MMMSVRREVGEMEEKRESEYRVEIGQPFPSLEGTPSFYPADTRGHRILIANSMVMVEGTTVPLIWQPRGVI